MKGSNRLTLGNLSVCKKTVRKLLKVDPIHLLQVAASIIFRFEKNLFPPFSDNRELKQSRRRTGGRRPEVK